MDPADCQQPLKRVGPAEGRTVAEFRANVDAWLHGAIAVSEERRADILLATDEALSNCADHAYRAQGEPGPMTLEMTPDSGQILRVCVTDHGEWQEPVPRATPTSLRGRGIRLMRGLCDDVSIDGRPDGTTVCLLFRDCPVKDERFAGSAVRQ